MLWLASRGGGCCAQGANSMSHLGGPNPNPLPCSFLHSLEMVVMFITYDLDIDNSMSHLGGQLKPKPSLLISAFLRDGGELLLLCWPCLSQLRL